MESGAGRVLSARRARDGTGVKMEADQLICCPTCKGELQCTPVASPPAGGEDKVRGYRYAVRKAAQCELTNMAFLHGDAHHLPIKDGSVDVANCCGAMHLFADVRGVLGELARVIRPGGRFSAAMAMRTSNLFNRIKARADERYWKIHYFRQEEIKDLLAEAGFEPTIQHARGIWMIVGATRRS